MNRVYEWAIRLQDLVSPTLQRISQQYGASVSRWDRLTSRFRSSFAGASQSVDQLRRKLDALKGKRDLMVDTRQIRRANREIEVLERRLNRLQTAGTRGNGGGSGGGGSGLLGNLVRGALPALGVAGLIAGAGSAFGSGMNREQTQLQFQQFLKTPEATKAMFGQLNQFADKTPFTNEEVYGAGRSMLAARIDPAELNQKLQNVGNMSAASGKQFGDLSEAYAKIKSKGFIDGGELHQEFGGTLLMEQLKKNLKLDGEGLFKAAEKRQIKFDDVDKAIADLTNGNGDYAGSLDKLANSAGGKLSTFLGTMGNKIAEWAATQNSTLGKIFDFGTEFLSKMQPIEDAVAGLMVAFKPLGDSLYGLMLTFGLVSEKGTAVEGVINAIAGVFRALTTVVQVFASPIGQVVLLLAGVLKGAMMLNAGLLVLRAQGITSLIGALRALWVVMLANPVTAILVGFALIGVGLKLAYDNVEWFRRAVDGAWTFIKEMFVNMGVILRALLMPTPANLQAAFAAIGKAWNRATEVADQADQDRKRQRAENDRDDRGHVYSPKTKKERIGSLAASGSGSSIGKAGGVSATTGGTKSTSITINFSGKMVDHLTIHAAGVQQGLGELEAQVQDLFMRVLYSGTALDT